MSRRRLKRAASAAALMVQGTSSWAGKSLIATALCRHFARQGLRVAPFKAQNMSNNARVVAGGEIGVAQYLQALAAGIDPDVRMNPVLVKPETDTTSQVIVRGRVDPALSALRWEERAPHLWPAASEALASLLAEYDLVILEGAGSPAEINLRDHDLANVRSARQAAASVLLVCDIDRGGAFAHLYGTWALMDPPLRRQLGGFVLNKFRGDPKLLGAGPQQLEDLTGTPVVGVVPWFEHRLPDEDGARQPTGNPARSAPRVAAVRYPRASNLDEFKQLEQVADVRWAQAPEDLEGAAVVVLPGSKRVAADLAWLRSNAIDRAVIAAARSGTPVLGVCGGLQMLGERLRDRGGVDGDAEGLGLLPISTVFEPRKLTRAAELRFHAHLDGPWAALAGRQVRGYEIRHGRIDASPSATEALAEGGGWVSGSVLGISVHGVFEEPDVLAALFGGRGLASLEDAIDELTDAAVQGIDARAIGRLAGLA